MAIFLMPNNLYLEIRCDNERLLMFEAPVLFSNPRNEFTVYPRGRQVYRETFATNQQAIEQFWQFYRQPDIAYMLVVL